MTWPAADRRNEIVGTTNISIAATLSEAARYTKEANRKRLAKEAGKLISGTGIGNPENQFAKTKRKPLKKRR